MATFFNPYTYIAQPNSSRPVSNGFVYFGRPDGDPTNPADQVQARVLCECSSNNPLNVSQPLTIGAGGVVVYNGAPAQVDLEPAEYSITVQDKNRTQVYYSPRVTIIDSSVVSLATTFEQCSFPNFNDQITYKKSSGVYFDDGNSNELYYSQTDNNTSQPTDINNWRRADLAFLPLGVGMLWAGRTPPMGWVESRGQPTLNMPQAVIDLYGTNFPESRAEYLRIWDNGRMVDEDREILSRQVAGTVDADGTSPDGSDLVSSIAWMLIIYVGIVV